MSGKITGSLDVLSALEITSAAAGLDAASKQLLRHKEILAIIAQGTIEEYQAYSLREIMDFIEADSIKSPEVSRSRTNTVIRGEPSEFKELHEKASYFDMVFRARNPKLSKRVLVNLHIDYEAQMDYRPGYPIEKRGMYYLARGLSSQLNLLTETTDYGQLEKCYSVWICRDRVPVDEQFSMSHCRMHNHKNIGRSHMRKEDYDLMQLVIVRLGSSEYPEDKKDLFQFLTALFYPHKQNFKEIIGQYIDFETHLKLKEEVTKMTGLGMSVLREGWMKGEAAGKAESVLELLAEAGEVPAELSKQIQAETDEGRLHRWLKLAAKAASVEEFVKAM